MDKIYPIFLISNLYSLMINWKLNIVDNLDPFLNSIKYSLKKLVLDDMER